MNVRAGKFAFMEHERPALIAGIKGGATNPEIKGTAKIYKLSDGLYLIAEIEGLPADSVFGFRISGGAACGSGDDTEQLSSAGSRFGASSEDMRSYHAGDLPPLFSSGSGSAFLQVYVSQASAEQVSGKPIVIHKMPDDFRTQPSGGAGVRIACGILAENL